MISSGTKQLQIKHSVGNFRKILKVVIIIYLLHSKG